MHPIDERELEDLTETHLILKEKRLKAAVDGVPDSVYVYLDHAVRYVDRMIHRYLREDE